MARERLVPGEKPLYWVGSAKRDLLGFPDAVRDYVGIALSVAQFGGKHGSVKPWKGEGGGVMEVVANHSGDTWRAVYTVRFEEAVYVLHAFQKKAAKGIKTTHSDIRLIAERLRQARKDYEERHGYTEE